MHENNIKNMIIIVEGLDKSGKSTIVNDLVESQKNFYNQTPVVFKLSSKPIDGSPEEQRKVLCRYEELFAQAVKLHDQGHVVIFDRAYPSEMVYSIKRGYDSLNDFKWLEFDKKIGNLEEVFVNLIYCEAPRELLIERFKSDKEEFTTVKEIDTLIERYESFLDCTSLKPIRISSTESRIDNLQKIYSQI